MIEARDDIFANPAANAAPAMDSVMRTPDQIKRYPVLSVLILVGCVGVMISTVLIQGMSALESVQGGGRGEARFEMLLLLARLSPIFAIIAFSVWVANTLIGAPADRFQWRGKGLWFVFSLLAVSLVLSVYEVTQGTFERVSWQSMQIIAHAIHIFFLSFVGIGLYKLRRNPGQATLVIALGSLAIVATVVQSGLRVILQHDAYSTVVDIVRDAVPNVIFLIANVTLLVWVILIVRRDTPKPNVWLAVCACFAISAHINVTIGQLIEIGSLGGSFYLENPQYFVSMITWAFLEVTTYFGVFILAMRPERFAYQSGLSAQSETFE